MTIPEIRAARAADERTRLERYHRTRRAGTCQMCGANGTRWLTVGCSYAISEAIPEAVYMAGTGVTPEEWHLLLCKGCRSDFLVMLETWRELCKCKLGKVMDRDGVLQPAEPVVSYINIYGAAIPITVSDITEIAKAEDDNDLDR